MEDPIGCLGPLTDHFLTSVSIHLAHISGGKLKVIYTAEIVFQKEMEIC